MLKLIVIVVLSGVAQNQLFVDVVEGLRRHGYPNIVMDNTIGEVSKSLAKLIASSPEDTPIKEINAHLSMLLKRQGVSDATYWTSIVRGSRVDGHHVLKDVLPKLNRDFKPNRLGIGHYQDQDERLVVSILVHRAGEFHVEQSRAQPGRTKVIKGTLQSGYFQPRVIVQTHDGQIKEYHPKLDKDRGFEMLVESNVDAPHTRIELVAEHVSGPRVLNLVESVSDRSNHGLPVIRMERPSGLPPEKELHRRINQMRMHQGMPELVWIEALASVAQTHAGFISQRRALTHKAQTHGHLRQRLSAQSIRPSYMSELLVSAQSPLEALEAIKTSPAHFQQIGHNSFNTIGIGVHDGYYVVILTRFERGKSEVD